MGGKDENRLIPPLEIYISSSFFRLSDGDNAQGRLFYFERYRLQDARKSLQPRVRQYVLHLVYIIQRAKYIKASNQRRCDQNHFHQNRKFIADIYM